MLLVTILAVRLAIVFNKEGGVETFVADNTGKASFVVWFGGGTDDLFGEIDGCIAACALWRCRYGESRHGGVTWEGQSCGRLCGVGRVDVLIPDAGTWRMSWCQSEYRRSQSDSCFALCW